MDRSRDQSVWPTHHSRMNWSWTLRSRSYWSSSIGTKVLLPRWMWFSRGMDRRLSTFSWARF